MLTMGSDYEHSETQLEQAMALNRMLLDALDQDRKDRRKTRRINLICATVCLVSLLGFVAIIGAVASGIVIETTTTETTVTQDTGEGNGNNVYQAGEYATYNQPGGAE